MWTKNELELQVSPSPSPVLFMGFSKLGMDLDGLVD